MKRFATALSILAIVGFTVPEVAIAADKPAAEKKAKAKKAKAKKAKAAKKA